MLIEPFSLKGGLSKEQFDVMHEKALHLLATVGINVPHKGILDRLANHNGVTIEGETVKFRGDLVEKALREAKYTLPEYAKDGNWVISAGAHQPKLYDLYTSQLRDATLADLIDMIKLGNSYDTVGSAPLVPLDQPPYLQEILMHKVAYEYSRRHANDLFEHDPKPTVECARYVYEMAQAAGKWFSVGLYMISPRTFAKNELDVIYDFLDKGVPMFAGTLPIAGVNAPVNMLGATLQAMFELLGCLTMLNLINTKGYSYVQFIDGFVAHPFDMRYSTFVYGSVEDVLGDLYKIRVHQYYGIPYVSKALIPSAKEPDAHAGFEVGVHVLMAALAGARYFRCGGLISSAEIYSAEQLVMDVEMVEYVKNLLRPEDFSEERLMVDEIAAVGPGQSFVGRKSTLKNFRKEYWEPSLFTHSNVGQWIEMGSKSTVQMANEIAKKRIREHTYTASDEVRKELDRILECARNDEKLKKSFEVSLAGID